MITRDMRSGDRQPSAYEGVKDERQAKLVGSHFGFVHEVSTPMRPVRGFDRCSIALITE
jgi:hypothetical protein